MFRGMSDYARGLAITALGVLIITPDALLLRLISADHWTVLVWRGLGFLLVQAMIVLARHGRGSAAALRRTGMDGLLVFVLFSLSQCLFVHSITHTTVANTLVIIAAAPLMAALFAWLMLRERVERRTLVAGFIGLGAVALTLSTSIGHGRLDGDLSALATMLLLALLFTLLRR
ncbi:MAG: EamA family transporter, partial [Geminicoccaceae bacterium]|nr:EamA family transporter [Geminicoccaceae bacterium]